MNAEFLLIIAIGIVGFIVQAKLQSVFKKYSKVMFPGGLTGRDVAERMLHDNGIYDVKVVSTPGHLTDHYNPATKTVNLSESVYASNSVAAAAVAAHRVRACGTARQGIRPTETPLGARAGRQLLVSMGRMGRNSRNPDDEDVSRAVLGRYRNDRRLGPVQHRDVAGRVQRLGARDAVAHG